MLPLKKTSTMFTVLGLLLFTQSALAGGSLSTTQILAETNAELVQTLDKNFSISNVALGMRISGQISPELGGSRVGPYITCAKPAGAAGPYTLSLVFFTDTKYKNTKGQYIDLGLDAVAIEEKVIKIQLARVAGFCNTATFDGRK